MKLHIASARVLARRPSCWSGWPWRSPDAGEVRAAPAVAVAPKRAKDRAADRAKARAAPKKARAARKPRSRKPPKANEELEERPTSVGIKTPVGKPIPKGKTIDFIQCGVPACKTEGELFESAAGELGWTIKSINAGTTPEEIKAAYDQAIKDEPDAVLGSGYPRSLFEPEIAELKAKNIPVIEFFVEEEAGNGITAVIGGIPTTESRAR